MDIVVYKLQKALEHIRSNGSSPQEQKAVRQSANAKPCITMAAGDRKFFRNKIRNMKMLKITAIYDRTLPPINTSNK
jgi:hypothetical protein